MNILDFNWTWFGVICISIAVIRLLFARILPIKLISILTAATFGFFVFLALPILVYSEELAFSAATYSALVVIAYTCFMIGGFLSKKVLGKSSPTHSVFDYKPAAYQFSLLVATLFVIIGLSIFLATNGLSKVFDVFLGGWSHLAEVEAIGERAANIQGIGVKQVFKTIAEVLFVCIWILSFKKWPKWSMVIWFLGILITLDQYTSRSELLGKAIVPYLAYLEIIQPSRKKILVQFAAITLVTLIYFSWQSRVRIGDDFVLAPDAIISSTLRDAGNSIVPASEILESNIRGNKINYFKSMLGFLIPRAIWHDKPDEQFNYEITYILSGKPIGKGNSVITTTMLGEAWYYFGWSGTIWLMLIFGFTVYAFDRLFALDPLLLGGYFILLYQGFIQIRSTYLTFFQQGVLTLLIGLILLMIFRLLFQSPVKSNQGE